MTDVFISYARRDRDVALGLAEALRRHAVSVWWDYDLLGGENFRVRIHQAIDSAVKVLVLWSKTSATSAFVIDEASEAKRLGKLVPLSIDGARPPFGFGDLHTIDARDVDAALAEILSAMESKPASASSSASVGEGAWSSGATRTALLSSIPRKAIGSKIGRRSVLLAGAAALGVAGFALPRMIATALAPPASGPQSGLAGGSIRSASRYALVVGNQHYRGGKADIKELANPIRDVEEIKQQLEEHCGFKVILRTDLDADGLKEAIKVLENNLSVSGGIGLFYYAGNAVRLNGDDIVMPIDARYDKATGTVERGVNLTMLQQQIKAETKLAERDDGMVVIYSASKGQSAWDGPPGAHSPFATAVLSVLPELEGDLDEFYERVNAAMKANAAQMVADRPDARAANIRLLTKAKPAPTARQTPNLERIGSPPPFFFNDKTQDQNIGLLRILIIDSPRDDPRVSTVLSQ